VIGSAKAIAKAVPTITPSSGPGISASALGLNWFHNTIVAMVTIPAIAARWWTELSVGIAFITASGIAAMLSRPLARGESSSITCSCEAKISTPIPASIPWITEGEIARNHWPSFSIPASSWSAPAISPTTPSMIRPCSCTSW
jgi:hypothetical protein